MLKRFRHHINPPMVVALIALFAALGGGYASAFSGSGTLQKAKTDGFPELGLTQVRSLTGIGGVEVDCDGGQITLRFHNTSGQALVVRSDDGDPNPTNDTVSNNQSKDYPVVGAETLEWHIYPAADDDKRPQAEVTISTLSHASCSSSGPEVAVLALNTEE